MTQPQQPLEISEYFEQAQDFVRSLVDKVELQSALLDDWHSTDNKKGARIIYGSSHVEMCNRNCAKCELGSLLGSDNQTPKIGVHTTLCATVDRHQELFALATSGIDLGQTMLNCKTLAQYEEAFVLFAVQRCPSYEELDAELRWVLGYRALYFAGSFDAKYLAMVERSSKQRIIRTIYWRIPESDESRREQVCRFARKHGFSL